MSYSEDRKKSPSLDDWLGELEGSIVCDCGHGCQDWIVNNGPKALMLIRAMKNGATPEELDAIVLKMTTEVKRDVWDEVRKRAKDQ